MNDIVIGEPDDFVTAGPASVCMREMVVTPWSGEKAYLTYSGIHNGSIRLVLADGDYVEFTYGEIFLDRHSPDQRADDPHEGHARLLL